MTAIPQMSCDEVEALLPLVADGTLDATNEPALFSHVASCQRCQDSLALHDLVGISLSQTTAMPAPRVLRPMWRRYAPAAAAAAMLLIGVGALSWPEYQTTPASQVDNPAGLVAKAKPAAVVSDAPAQVAPAPPVQMAHNEPVDVEVMAIPGSTPNHPHYLVRKGEQPPSSVQSRHPATPRQQATAAIKP
jgi:anti-sigma factor ChrR (cupin superfamily)